MKYQDISWKTLKVIETVLIFHDVSPLTMTYHNRLQSFMKNHDLSCCIITFQRGGTSWTEIFQETPQKLPPMLLTIKWCLRLCRVPNVYMSVNNHVTELRGMQLSHMRHIPPAHLCSFLAHSVVPYNMRGTQLSPTFCQNLVSTPVMHNSRNFWLQFSGI